MPRFELKGKVQLDGNQWQAGLNQAGRAADKWSSETAGMIKRRLASAFAVASLIRGFTTTVDKAVDIRNKSGKIGVDPETFQAMEYAAEQSGASIDDVTQSIIELGKKQQEVGKGSKDVTDAFRRFGLEFDDVVNRDPVELFNEISKAVNSGVNPQNLMADIDKLLSGSGQNLIQAFKSDFSGMMAEGRTMPTFTNEQVPEIAAVGDDITRGQKSFWSGVGKSIAWTKDAINMLAGQNEIVARFVGERLGANLAGFDPEHNKSMQIQYKLEEHLREIRRNTDVLP